MMSVDALIDWNMSSWRCRPEARRLRERFCSGVLEIPEVPKPTNLAKRGGCWFERGDLKIHLGVSSRSSYLAVLRCCSWCSYLTATLATDLDSRLFC
jgi:hypothetical protein